MVPTLLHHGRSIANEANTLAIVVSLAPKRHQQEKSKEKLKKKPAKMKEKKAAWKKNEKLGKTGRWVLVSEGGGGLSV